MSEVESSKVLIYLQNVNLFEVEVSNVFQFMQVRTFRPGPKQNPSLQYSQWQREAAVIVEVGWLAVLSVSLKKRT